MIEQHAIENEFQKYNRLKVDLLKISKCIECCEEKEEQAFYQNLAIEYSKELKNLKKSIENEYHIILCDRCVH
ncbi:hypothetical protein G3A_13580 [Bacillus sp. 17376]|uniref:Uncharacterized protein n=1 Tax=Mesobacillus boroniphilus JCM 21738 TaxID=1294265 RepID=W4RSN8_9BACI|nr:hypothetical protein [Mesobacillus boroniphilus]ESU32006.1 hypothetical protein G3A_13580 [Bacillus sp. 17376]GAE47117.1 hypothetical protein JCM21738_4065 [Mesobacillus boroniphilus JCM 21738]